MSLTNNKYAREQRINRNLTITSVIMGVVIIALVFLAFKLARPITVELLPQINQVETVTSGETQLHNVYGLGSLVFVGLNTWEEDGQIEYLENIKKYLHFVDEEFKEWLVNDYSYKKEGDNINELDSRTKQVYFLDQFYKPEKVKALGNGTWVVYMKLEVREKIGKLLIKHYTGDFEIYVSKSTASTVNPWGLKVSGQPIEIKRIETFR